MAGRAAPRSSLKLRAGSTNCRLDVGLLTNEGYDAQFAALQAETDALLLRGRGRSSIGDAGSPVPTTASAAAAAPVSAAPVQLPVAGIASRAFRECNSRG